MGKQLILLLSGPSGVGKTTLCEKMIREFEDVQRVITSTTRAPRCGEINGVDYYFLSNEDFLKNVENGDFLENAIVYGNHYGVQRTRLLNQLNIAKDLIITLDVKGAETFRKNFKLLIPTYSLVDVFISVTSIDVLRNRLINRRTDDLDKIQKRLNAAEGELQLAPNFKYTIYSSNEQSDWLSLKNIYLQEKDN